MFTVVEFRSLSPGGDVDRDHGMVVQLLLGVSFVELFLRNLANGYLTHLSKSQDQVISIFIFLNLYSGGKPALSCSRTLDNW